MIGIVAVNQQDYDMFVENHLIGFDRKTELEFIKSSRQLRGRHGLNKFLVTDLFLRINYGRHEILDEINFIVLLNRRNNVNESTQS